MNCNLCFCGSIKCQILPIIVYGINVSERTLFFEYEIDAFKKWIPEEETSKTSIYVPAKGIEKGNRFEGTCGVCGIKYLDYGYHINLKTHKNRISRKRCTKYIEELCEFVHKTFPISKKEKESFKLTKISNFLLKMTKRISNISINNRINHIPRSKRYSRRKKFFRGHLPIFSILNKVILPKNETLNKLFQVPISTSAELKQKYQQTCEQLNNLEPKLWKNYTFWNHCCSGSNIIPILPNIGKADYLLLKKYETKDLCFPIKIEKDGPRGNGLFASRNIEIDEIICLYSGKIMTDATALKMINYTSRSPLHHYALGLNKDFLIIPIDVVNFGHLINCNILPNVPNCKPILMNSENGPIAVIKSIETIKENKQIFWNYNSNHDNYSIKGFI